MNLNRRKLLNSLLERRAYLKSIVGSEIKKREPHERESIRRQFRGRLAENWFWIQKISNNRDLNTKKFIHGGVADLRDEDGGPR